MLQTILLVIISIVLIHRGIVKNLPFLLILGCLVAIAAGWVYN